MAFENRFKDRTVVVTGAGSGFGEAMARRFAAEGATVLAADINASAVERVKVATAALPAA